MTELHFDTLSDLFRNLVPIYKGKSWRPFVASFKWDRSATEIMRSYSASRCDKRLTTYLIPGELDRASATSDSSSGSSIRFVNVKTGHGFVGKRKDFCLVGGAYRQRHLTSFYRRLELLGGLFFDLPVISEVEEAMGTVRRVTLMAMQADVFAREGGSNQKLYRHLKEKL